MLVVVLAAVVIAALGLYRLRGYRYPFDVREAWAGVRTVLPVTGRTALLMWSVLAIELGFLTGWWRRVHPLSRAEAAAAAVLTLWGGGYVTLLLLGPSHAYRPVILRLVLLLVAVAAWRGSIGKTPLAPQRRGGFGPWLAIGALLLAGGPLLLMQLGSPVSPFMDVLPYVAATQKIVTFQYYDPLQNDAAGLWPPQRQVPGVDGPISLLSLAVGSSARLGTTSLIVPVAALNLLAMYLLGRHVRSGLTGGMACLFLLQTFLWRRSSDVRSTALAFPVVALGLVFLLGRRRSGARAALGGMALGLAVAVNPLIGAFGMQVASLGTIVEWLDFRRGFFVRGVVLAAGVVFALPAVLLNEGVRSPLWSLALPALAAVAFFVWLARADDRVFRRARGTPTPWARLACLVGAPLAALWFHAGREAEFYPDDWSGYPILTLLAAGGLAVLVAAVWRRPRRLPAVYLPALALLVGMLDFVLISPHRFSGPLEMKALASASTPKIILYWAPYWMAVLAGAWLANLARRALVPAVVLALVLVMYPIRHVAEPLDFDGAELSLVGTWGFHLTHAARGYWAGRGDRRWVLDENYQAVADYLKAEIARGAIDYYTHVMVISPQIESVEVALATGISADVVSPQFDPNGYWNVGSRARKLDQVAQAFEERPPYVVIEHYRPSQFPQLSQYEEVVAQQYVRLYRLRSGAAS